MEKVCGGDMSTESSIKPIETSYRGYKFRSRLEARWAVFFDAMGWTWEYEPEGFKLKDGTWYLPDFMVINSHHTAYYEIKPINITRYDYRIAYQKLYRLTVESKIKSVLLVGQPDYNAYDHLENVVFRRTKEEMTDPYELDENGKYEWLYPEYYEKVDDTCWDYHCINGDVSVLDYDNEKYDEQYFHLCFDILECIKEPDFFPLPMFEEKLFSFKYRRAVILSRQINF